MTGLTPPFDEDSALEGAAVMPRHGHERPTIRALQGLPVESQAARYFFNDSIPASTSALWDSMPLTVHSLTILPSGEIRKVVRSA